MPSDNARHQGPAEGDEPLPVRNRQPLVTVAIAHLMMRSLTGELLEREGACQVTAMGGDDQALADAIDRDRPDLVIIDTGEFPASYPAALRRIPPARVIVIGPEPAGSYRTAALTAGAGAWISCDRVGEDLIAGVCRLLGSQADPFHPTPGGVACCGGPSVVDRRFHRAGYGWRGRRGLRG